MKNHGDAPSYSIPIEARTQIGIQLAVAWDGQWFLKVCDKFGWDTASEINARERPSFSRMEMRATLRALGKRKANDLADALAVWRAYMYQIFFFGTGADAWESDQVIEGDTIHMTLTKCAVMEGAKRAKLERTEQACIACATAWSAWFGALLPDYEVSDEIIAQMGYGAPQCQIRVRAVPR
jgi:hypothetical protein